MADPELIDHRALAESRLVTQFRESPNLIAYIKTLLIEADTLEQLINDVMTDRWLDNASGVQLDIIGVIVGQTRTLIQSSIIQYFGFDGDFRSETFSSFNNPALGGRFRSFGEPVDGIRTLEDVEFRAYIRARIAKNSTRSTPEDIIAQIKLVFSASLVLFTDGDTEYNVDIGKVLSANEQALLFTSDIFPKTAGVQVNYTTMFDGGNFFSFQGVPGSLGFGSTLNPSLGGKLGTLI